jgi:hypothetical protein
MTAVIVAEYGEEFPDRPTFREVQCCGSCKRGYFKSYTIGETEYRCSLDFSETWQSFLCDKFEGGEI